MTKPPAFQLYAKDALDAKVVRMSDAAQGVYWRLIFHIWAHTKTQYSIQDREKNLAKMLGISSTKWKKYRQEIQQDDDPLFIEEDGMLISKRLYEEREKQLARRGQRKDAALAKWGTKPNQEKRSERLAKARSKGRHTGEQWLEMKEFFQYACLKCHQGEPEIRLVKDHIVPLYQGGSDSIANIQPLCHSCNSSKGPDSTDCRLIYCQENACEMPAEWLQNAYSSSSSSSTAKDQEITTVETNEFFTVKTKAHERYQKNYLISDEELRGEYRRMAEWLRANPNRLKKNYARFITNWLGKHYEQRKAVRDARTIVGAAAAKVKVEPKAEPVKKVKRPQKSREEQLAELEIWRRENE